MSRRNIPELLQVRAEDHDLPWLKDSLQWAVELEFGTIPVYLSGMWSIKEQSGDAYDLIHGVVLEEMLHMGWACNMLTAIDVTPQITAPSYPGPLPGGVQPGFDVYLGGLNKTTVAMYMQIELPEHPVAEAAETFPTIGAFYDAISAAFTALFPSNHQFSTTNQIGDFPIGDETLTVLTSLDDVQNAIATIKEQGEGTSTSPDAPQFGGELAHYYRFGEILNEKKLIEVDGRWQYTGDAVPFPDCYPVAVVPAEGYPGVEAVQAFDKDFGTLIGQLQNAWSLPSTNPEGGSNALNAAVGTMFALTSDAQTVVAEALPDGSGNYGPDFRPPAAVGAGAGSTSRPSTAGVP
jgi:hypothetical protein